MNLLLNLLNQAVSISEEFKLTKLTEITKNERNSLNNEIYKCNSLIDSNTSLKEILNEPKILEYIKEASITPWTSCKFF